MSENLNGGAAQSSLGEIRTPPGSYFIGNFDDKDRYLRFDLNAFAELEERYGSMDELEKIMQKGSMKDLRTLLWCGLLHEGAKVDPHTGDILSYEITPYQVGSWITMDNMKQLMDSINAAVTAATPTAAQTAPQLTLATPQHVAEPQPEQSTDGAASPN